MKKSIRFLSVFLSTVLGCSMVLSACNQEESSSVQTVKTVKPVAYTDGVHDYTAPERRDYLVQNGTSEYRLVLPENADAYTTFAKDEFVYFFEEATNITLPTVTESGEGLAHSKTAKYISLGNTKMLESAGLEADESVLGTQGLRIKTIDDTIYLFGGGFQGVLYAVYDFLQIVFNYEIYYHDVWEIDKNVKNVKMRDFNVTDVPDIEIRHPSFGTVNQNVNNLGYRLRVPMGYLEYIMPIGDLENGSSEASIHNTDDILPRAYWYDSHPSWFSDSGGQLCYTAHGDPEEYEAMVTQIVKVMLAAMKRYPATEFPQYKYLGFMLEDLSVMCACDACANATILYGAAAGAVVKMCNAIMEKLKAEQEKPEHSEYKREDLTVLFFSYMSLLAAPVRYDKKTEKYVATHPDVQPRHDVGVWFAMDKGIMNYHVDVYDDVQEEGRRNLEGWAELANNGGGGMHFWTYCASFSAYMFPVDTFNHFTSEGYQYYVAHGAKLFDNQGERQNQESCNFDGLKMYLDAKLQWDCTLDEQVLIDNWFNAMYGSIAPLMKDFWYAQREWSAVVFSKIGNLTKYSINPHLYSSSILEYVPLLKLLEQCNAIHEFAYKVYAENEPETYEMIKRNIDLEWTPIAYMLLSLHADGLLPNDRIESIKTYFYSLEETLLYMQSAEAGATSIWTEIRNDLG